MQQQRPCFEDSRFGNIVFAVVCVAGVIVIAWRFYRVAMGQP